MSGVDRDGSASRDCRFGDPASELGPLPIWTLVALVGAGLGESVGSGALGSNPSQLTTSGWWIIALLAGAAFTTMSSSWSRDEGAAAGWCRARGVVGVVLVTLVSFLGVVLRVAVADEGLLPELADQGGRRVLRAVVAQEPRAGMDGWNVIVRVEQVAGVDTRERAAMVTASPPPTLGSRWELRASARPLPEGGYGRWLARQHATVLLDVASMAPAGRPGALAASTEHVRRRIRRAATLILDDDAGGLLVGLVTGDTRLLPEGDRRAMRASGLTHLTAVSGANLAVVIGGLLAVLCRLLVPVAWSRGVIGVAVAWFSLLTRFEPSVLRAGTMALVLLLVAARGVVRDPRHALAGAVLLLVLVDPRQATSVGLLLSAAATIGVLVVAPRLRPRLRRLPGRLNEVASLTIGAQLAVAPLVLVAFEELPVASIPANLVAVPAAAVAAVPAFVAAVLALISVEAAGWLFAVAGIPAHVILVTAHALAGVGGSVSLASPSTIATMVSIATWLLARPGTRTARRAVVVLVVAATVALRPVVIGGIPPDQLRLTAIDVGQGDAFLIESPRARILVDAGTDDTAARWLRANGRRKLDLAVVTHPHLDHVGGMPEVLRRVHVDDLWLRPPPEPHERVNALLQVAASRNVPVRAPATADRVRVADLQIDVLHAPRDRPYRGSPSELNETSLVLRIRYGDRRVLVTGDVEVGAQTRLLADRGPSLRSEVLLVPHHGAATSLPAFLAAVRPTVGVISVGRDNDHGHPHPDTLAALDRLDVRIRRTDQEGTLVFEVPSPAPPDGTRPPSTLAP